MSVNDFHTVLATCTWPPVGGVDLALHIRLHQPAGVGRCRVRTSEEGRVKSGAAALMSTVVRRLIAVDLRRVCAHVNRLWSWRGGAGLSRWFEYLLPLSGVVRCSPGVTLFLPVFVIPGVFSSSPLPFINTGTLVVFSRDCFLCLLLCLLNSLFCRRIYCFLYLEPSSAFYTFSIFIFFLHQSLKLLEKTNKKKTLPRLFLPGQQIFARVLGKHVRGFDSEWRDGQVEASRQPEFSVLKEQQNVMFYKYFL